MNAFFSAPLRLSIITAAVFAVLLVTGCESNSAEDDERVRVVTTLPLFADMIANVGGDRVEVTALLPRGADPHTWEPAPKDAKKVEEADIAFVNGLDLDDAAIDVFETNVRSGVSIVKVGEESFGASENPVFAYDGYEFNPEFVHNGADPHLWLHPHNARAYVEIIRDRLIEVDQAGTDTYRGNYEKYASSLEELELSLAETVSGVPEEARKLITTHDAFRYLAGAIRFEITAFVAVGPGQDPSPDDIRAIVAAVEEQGVRAVFTEPQISGESEMLKQVARDTGAMICTLYSDSLDDEVNTYIEMMRFNADEIARCLGGVNGG